MACFVSVLKVIAPQEGAQYWNSISYYFLSYHITRIANDNIPANPASPNWDIIRPNPAMTPKKSSNRIPTIIPITTNILARSIS